MREIKFRAWVSDDDENFFMCRDVTGYDSYKHLISNKDYNYYNFELMQYTGLKDKNGVEIYEGDIVKSWTGLREIIYDNARFTIKINSNTFEGFDWELCEVIGNIYDNPDLIKKDLH